MSRVALLAIMTMSWMGGKPLVDERMSFNLDGYKTVRVVGWSVAAFELRHADWKCGQPFPPNFECGKLYNMFFKWLSSLYTVIYILRT